MDYLNPTSIAQMAQVPKDTSLPGTGYGLVQGFNEGQAMMRAKDFLDMSKASQAQNYVKNQFDMQTAWEDYPLAREQKQANLDQTTSSTGLNKFKLAEAHEQLKKTRMLDHFRFAGGSADAFRNAKTPLEKRAVYEQLRKAHEMGGVPIDEDLNYTPGDPESEKRVQMYLDMARDLVAYSPDTLGDIAKTNPRLRSAEDIAGKDRSSKEKMNREDNDTALAIAGMRSEAQRVSSAGSQALNAYKADLAQKWQAVIAKNPSTWTPEERAINVVASRILASQFTTADEITNNPERQGAVTGARKEEGIKSVIKGLDSLNAPKGQADAFGDPSVINRGVSPPPNIQGTPIDPKDKFNSYLEKYAPRK